MKLIIFDLDQTLVDSLSFHDEAVRRLFKKFFGVDARLTEIDFSGKSLVENFNELARLKGIPADAIEGKRGQMLEAYEAAFGESLPRDATQYILPGVRDLLGKLSKTDHIVVLYTGDSRQIVHLVLRATGLGKYFKFCFYGTEVEKRTDMVRLAVDRAKQSARQDFRNKDIVIIGDSVRDIECGRAFGAVVVAVATGAHSQEELLKAGADYVFDNLKDYRKVLTIIGP
jgi:phosphoglycolate phosphatase-like HAD superfamily hydrolase